MNVIQLSCAAAPTSAHIFCMLKNVSVFSRVNVDARRTSDQRQSNTEGAKPPFFRKTDMACCKRLADGNHLYIYSGTQPRWTTLQFFCRKCTKRENPRWPEKLFHMYNFLTISLNFMCDIWFLRVFCMPTPFVALFH